MEFPKINSQNIESAKQVIDYQIVKTRQRLTFDIVYQHPDTIYQGEDDGDYYKFVASNGFEIISRSRMDIQTERLWLIGVKPNERSGSMVFSSDKQRDEACYRFHQAIDEWVKAVS
jgi:hypothetical protein